MIVCTALLLVSSLYVAGAEKIVDYDTGTAKHVQYGDPGKKVYGMYSYKSPDGENRKVSYVADDKGFHATTEDAEKGTGATEGRHFFSTIGAGLASASLAGLAGLAALGGYPRPQQAPVSSIAVIGIPITSSQTYANTPGHAQLKPQHGGYYQGIYDHGSPSGGSYLHGSSTGLYSQGLGHGSYVQGLGHGTYVQGLGQGTYVQGLGQGPHIQGSGQETYVQGLGQGPHIQGSGQGSYVQGLGQGTYVQGSLPQIQIQESGQGLHQGGSQGVIIQGTGQGFYTQRPGQLIISQESSENSGASYVQGQAITAPASQGTQLHSFYQHRYPSYVYRPSLSSSVNPSTVAGIVGGVIG